MDENIVNVKGVTGGFDTKLLKKATEFVDELILTEDGAHNEAYLYYLGVIHDKAVDEAVRLQLLQFLTYLTLPLYLPK